MTRKTSVEASSGGKHCDTERSRTAGGSNYDVLQGNPSDFNRVRLEVVDIAFLANKETGNAAYDTNQGDLIANSRRWNWLNTVIITPYDSEIPQYNRSLEYGLRRSDPLGSLTLLPGFLMDPTIPEYPDCPTTFPQDPTTVNTTGYPYGW